ncbi:hypothetical protein M404DRAFT_17812 [Pisolithus tinctorius Marx 270]|uniref:Uncharacterized protein n=1 Tax=Pisolithus tinctorius Marx 270 TaxID=870435 RepID=A0A0C3K0R6_PISTI|nr:hypothetical protein M404DRAFT_17812 [Pisolithus tinctorius Marx 270]
MTLPSPWEVPTPVAHPLRLHPHQGFLVRQVLAPRPRVSIIGDSKPAGKGKDKEGARHDSDHRTTASSPTNAPSPSNVCPEPVASRNAALDLLASVALAQDDKLRLPIAASDYLDVVRLLDVFNNRDNIDGCTLEQVKYFGLLSEIYRAADVIGKATNKIRTAQLSGTTPLAKVIMVSMLEKGYSDVLEAVTGGAYHHLRDHQVREFLAPTASQLLEQIRPKEDLVIPEMKPKADKEVQWDPPLEFMDNAMVFKEVGHQLGMGANGSAWEALLQNAMWSGIDKNYHNAIYATDSLPAAPFVPIPEYQLCYYLRGRALVPDGHPLYQHACYQCCHLGHWSCHNGQGSRWTPATTSSSLPPPPSLPVASHTHSCRPTASTPLHSHHSSSRV